MSRLEFRWFFPPSPRLTLSALFFSFPAEVTSAGGRLPLQCADSPFFSRSPPFSFCLFHRLVFILEFIPFTLLLQSSRVSCSAVLCLNPEGAEYFRDWFSPNSTDRFLSHLLQQPLPLSSRLWCLSFSSGFLAWTGSTSWHVSVNFFYIF